MIGSDMTAYDTIARMQIALAGGTIRIDQNESSRGTLLIDGESLTRVDEIPSSAQIIDCAGLTITRGFWNSHVHFFEPKWADAASIPAAELAQQLHDTYSRYGFT